MKTINLKQGDHRIIYEDPITMQKPEGYAVLLKLVKRESFIETWKVSFDGEDRILERRIAV